MQEQEVSVKTVPDAGFELLRGAFLLQLLFLGLWLSGNITWHWVWIFAPAWILPASVCAILLFMGLAVVVVAAVRAVRGTDADTTAEDS